MFLIKKAKVIDQNSTYNGKRVDILINKGQIKEINKNLSHQTARLIEAPDLHASIGWMDIGAQVGEPGFEHREDLNTVANAAAAGGYTALACFPNTSPVIQTKSEISFLKNNAQLVDFFPIGAVSQNCSGGDLAEMYDMAAAGAVAFSDGAKSIASAGLMKRGLMYLKGINGLLINQSFDTSLSKGGQIHEGKISTRLGMKGIPSLAETLMLKRDLDLLAYTDSKLHVHNISTAESVKLIKTAKAKGLRVTASVPIMNLIFNHEQLETFDPNFKVLPPLRLKSDVKALIKGVREGVIDIVNSNHTPLETEAKKLEYVYADFGSIGLETTYALFNTHFGKLMDISSQINLFSLQPRNILDLPIPSITVNNPANLTLFQPNKKWTFTSKDIFSKSKNTPLVDRVLKGKVLGVINGVYSSF